MQPELGAALAALLGAVLGGGCAILGGVVGGWVQGRTWYHYDRKRMVEEDRKRWERTALEWAAKGRVDTLRRANLAGARLDTVDLSRGFGHLVGHEVSADLLGSDLRGANLRNADLRGAILVGVDVAGADLRGAKLQGANLTLARNLDQAQWLGAEEGSHVADETIWPEGTAPADVVRR